MNMKANEAALVQCRLSVHVIVGLDKGVSVWTVNARDAARTLTALAH